MEMCFCPSAFCRMKTKQQGAILEVESSPHQHQWSALILNYPTSRLLQTTFHSCIMLYKHKLAETGDDPIH